MSQEKSTRASRIIYIIEVLNLTLISGILLGAIMALERTWKYDFKSLISIVVDMLRSDVNICLLLTLPAIFIYYLMFYVLSKIIKHSKLTCYLAGGIVMLPFFLLLGYRVNITYLPRFLEVTSIFWNIIISLGFLLLWFVISKLLFLWTKSRLLDKSGANIKILSNIRVFCLLLCLVLIVNILPYKINTSRIKDSKQVIILLIDALRADYLGCYGHDQVVSPNIDKFAEESVKFTQVISQSTFTKTSIASLFTSRYPYQHKVYWGNTMDESNNITSDILSEDENTLAEVLLQQAVVPVAWIHNPHLNSYMGFGQGFVEYHEQQGDINVINERFLKWLNDEGKDYRFFSYIHYIDLHDPYKPKPPYDTMYGVHSDFYSGIDFKNWGTYLHEIRSGERTLEQKDVDQLISYYNGLITYIDKKVGMLLNDLKNTGVYDNSLIILTADHGDGFMEHGFISHSTKPYDELLKVPLIIKFPDSEYAGKVIHDQVELIDIMPTILGFMGIEIVEGVEGTTLLNYLKQNAKVKEINLSQYSISEIAERDSYPISAVRTEDYKYIHFQNQEDEFYDLRTDPLEQNNIIDVNREEAEKFHKIQMKIVTERSKKSARKKTVLDKKTIKELKALGYIK